jgi:hypothetical protein
VFARQATVAIRAGRVERDAATLLRTTLVAIAGGQTVDTALGQGLDALIADEDDDGFWQLVDVLARVRNTDPEQLALVTELLDVVVRRASSTRSHGHGRGW